MIYEHLFERKIKIIDEKSNDSAPKSNENGTFTSFQRVEMLVKQRFDPPKFLFKKRCDRR